MSIVWKKLLLKCSLWWLLTCNGITNQNIKVSIKKIKTKFSWKYSGIENGSAPSEFNCSYCELPRVISCSISQLITVSFGLWKISYFSTLDCNIIKYSRWIWSYKSNHIRSKSHEDRKVFCTRIFEILICLYYIKKNLNQAFRLEHEQVGLGLKM